MNLFPIYSPFPSFFISFTFLLIGAITIAALCMRQMSHAPFQHKILRKQIQLKFFQLNFLMLISTGFYRTT
jgi:hypothetical protein